MVDVVFGFICAPLEDSWLLHLALVRAMLAWTFAIVTHNCGKYLSVYYTQMTGLEIYHVEMHDHLKIGGYFLANWIIKPIWQNSCGANYRGNDKDTQKGFSLNACVVSRYYMTFEYRKVYLWNLRHMVQVQTSGIIHVDLEPPRMLRNL